MKRRREPAALDDALRGAMRTYGLERRVREAEIFTRWNEIVGTAIANHATPRRFSQGTLWIRVPNAAWRQELILMRTQLARTINAAVGAEIVGEIVLR